MDGGAVTQKYVVQVIDDFDGSELAGDDAESVHFGLDGSAYVIDLSKGNADRLRETFARYTDAARRDQAAGRSQGSKRSSSPRAVGRKDLEQVRAWANEHGHAVSARGRVPNAVLEAYDAR